MAHCDLTYRQRIDMLRETKLRQTLEKQEVLVHMDYDDHGRILPPPELRDVVEVMSSSGTMIRDVKMTSFRPRANHQSGGFFGPKACGENFRRFLEAHPVQIDPVSSMAGAYMVYFMSYRNLHWSPDFDLPQLRDEQTKYGLQTGIGGTQHFCPDMAIGLELGWGGLLEKVIRFREFNPQQVDFYDGLEAVILGIQDWIRRHVETAQVMAMAEMRPQLRRNLEDMADVNERLITDVPRTFRDACQWIVWFQMVARMYNGSGAIGQIDELLRPYYERDVRAGSLTDEEAVFHLACLFANDTQYMQLGGPDVNGADLTSKVSFLILDAVHSLRVPANVGIRVHEHLDPRLLRRGIEVLLTDKMGFPKFLGDIGEKGVSAGFARNGYPIELGRQRVYSGCHWFAIAGREYCLNDCIKLNFASVFDAALREMLATPAVEPTVEELWRSFEKHLRRAVDVLAEGLDLHLRHMDKVFPELVIDLLCYGPIEKGMDASHFGTLEYYDLGVDGAGLATVADSFAALEQRVEKEARLTWHELLAHLDDDYVNAEPIRLMLRNVPHYGRGGTRADYWAARISGSFTRLVKERPTPAGANMIPGQFSWAMNIDMGRTVGATPNGRHARAPISHGANPDPGFAKGAGSPTALAVAVASVQCGYGNTTPLQLDFDPGILRNEQALEDIEALIKGHFDMGGTMINMNVLDKQKILAAHKDPFKYPDLIVRVTGFSAYFASLSNDMRQLVVDRILSQDN